MGSNKIWDQMELQPSSLFLAVSQWSCFERLKLTKTTSSFGRNGFAASTVLESQLRGMIKSVIFSWQPLRNTLPGMMSFSTTLPSSENLVCVPWTLWKEGFKNKVMYPSIKECNMSSPCVHPSLVAWRFGPVGLNIYPRVILESLKMSNSTSHGSFTPNNWINTSSSYV